MPESSVVWRLIDTGLRPAAQNMAINRAMLDAHQQGAILHTLRFLRFTPCALLGFHQSAEQELRTDYCTEHGIEIQRRITGGGAIYFDETQIGWELYLDKKTLGSSDMSVIAARICTAAAKGISRLGVNAVFRPRNDIEVDGRKVSGTGGAFDGDSILYQGTLLIDFDVERMLRVLRIPAEKLSDKAIASARERVVNLKDLLGFLPSVGEVQAALAGAFAEEFGVKFERAESLGSVEQGLYEEALREIDSPDWVGLHSRPATEAPTAEVIYRSPGGLMRAAVLLDTYKKRIKQVWITGDFFVNPRRMVADLESALRDTAIDDLRANVEHFFSHYTAEMLMLQPQDFIAALGQAVAQGLLAESVPDAAVSA